MKKIASCILIIFLGVIYVPFILAGFVLGPIFKAFKEGTRLGISNHRKLVKKAKGRIK